MRFVGSLIVVTLVAGLAGAASAMDTKFIERLKSEIVGKIADEHSLARKQVKAVIESLATVGYKELKRTGAFLVPGLAKFIVIKKPATKEREGINPFTKQPTIFKAKPARKIVKARPVKAAKDSV